MKLRLVATALALTLIFSAAPASAAIPLLASVHTVTADDGSARITLTFNSPAPVTRVVHNVANLVHVIFLGSTIGPSARPMVPPGGEIRSGTFSDFAGIGFRLDLLLVKSVPVRVESTPGTNVVIVHVSAAHSDVEASASGPVQTFNGMQTVYVPLSFADVSEVAGILVKDSTVSSLDGFTPLSPFAAPTPNPNSSGSSGPSTKTPTYVTLPTANIMTKDVPNGKRLDEHVAIDRRLNAVVLTGTPDQIASYRQIIRLIDVPEQSILIEAEIVELTESGAQDLGLDFSPGGGPLGTGALTLNSGSRATSTAALRVELNALSLKGAAKILARPRILTLNAKTAAILSGEAVPIINSVLVPSGGGTIIENQVQYINVGVSLQILPRVSADGRVTAQVFSEVSSIINYVGTAPRIAVRQGLTSGIVADGESLLVGGLMQQTEITSLSKVPGLGDIPLIGAFFRNNSTSSQTTNLYLVITPHVLTTKIR
ncbi:MAG: hypothetical protein M3R30_02055 [Candidatus Eremiobacteraeota bacterium]|nr:hypothetical protein [Candidatus Eremiobacteraeota bacterium]